MATIGNPERMIGACYFEIEERAKKVKRTVVSSRGTSAQIKAPIKCPVQYISNDRDRPGRGLRVGPVLERELSTCFLLGVLYYSRTFYVPLHK